MTVFVTTHLFYWLYSTSNELKSRGIDLPSFVLVFIPFANIYWVWKYCEGVEKVTSGTLTQVNAFLLALLLGPVGYAVIQSKYNEL